MSSLAKLYPASHPRFAFVVIHKNPDGKRIKKYFRNRKDAQKHLIVLNKALLTHGSAGLALDAAVRADAIAARQALDAASLQQITLLELARARIATAAPPPAKHSLSSALETFLEEKSIEDRSPATLKNLHNRLQQWFDQNNMIFVEDITRESCEALRLRTGISPLTRRNDMLAASNLCSWLADKRLIPANPMRELRKPAIRLTIPTILSTEEVSRLLNYTLKHSPRDLPPLLAMFFTGLRPSEIPSSRIIYDDTPAIRIEGGKMRGRANRITPLCPAALAWFKLINNPTKLHPLPDHRRQRLCRLANIHWHSDIHRHTYISNRLALTNDAASTAREAGTSESVMFARYARLRTQAEAIAYFSLFPTNTSKSTKHPLHSPPHHKAKPKSITQK